MTTVLLVARESSGRMLDSGWHAIEASLLDDIGSAETIAKGCGLLERPKIHIDHGWVAVLIAAAEPLGKLEEVMRFIEDRVIRIYAAATTWRTPALSAVLDAAKNIEYERPEQEEA